MISDFFYPNMGGVETHIWCLAQCLINRGHKVIVLTHAYSGRQGIRYMTNGLKVYYLPLIVAFDQVIFPTFYSYFALFRNILIRERIQIVHGHQSVSTLANECMLFARTLGYRVCFTDHSLFSFSEIPSIHINKVLTAVLSDVDHIICVSNTCRENLILRARLHPSFVSTIPNAVDTTKFTPGKDAQHHGHLHSLHQPYPTISSQHTKVINIVVISRLVYRKGIDLLVKVIPIICSMIPNVHFIVGGDGPKLLLLEEMREKYQLHDRIEFLGAVPHSEVRNVLIRGHIFLNCSLTESFCIALLEAASCGLFVVSTKVGGVPEVLPSTMIKFAEPNSDSLIQALLDAVQICPTVDPWEFHERVKSMYNWLETTKRIENVYSKIMEIRLPSLMMRLHRYQTNGMFSGLAMCCLMVFLVLLSRICDLIWPEEDIEICPDIILESTSMATERLKKAKS
jgi:phosphatidylinositol glycan class A protein